MCPTTNAVKYIGIKYLDIEIMDTIHNFSLLYIFKV